MSDDEADSTNDVGRILAVAAIGAALGGLAAYLVLTPQGRHLFTRINPALDDLGRVLEEVRAGVVKAEAAARDARAAASDVRAAVTRAAPSAED
jgi:hypothetical protein